MSDNHDEAARKLSKLPATFENVGHSHFDGQTRARRASRERQTAAIESRLKDAREAFSREQGAGTHRRQG